MAMQPIFTYQHLFPGVSSETNTSSPDLNLAIASQSYPPAPAPPSNNESLITSENLHRHQGLNFMGISNASQTNRQISTPHHPPPTSPYNWPLDGKINTPRDVYLYSGESVFQYIKELEAENQAWREMDRDIKARLSSLTAYGEACAALNEQRLARLTPEAHSSPAVQFPYNRGHSRLRRRKVPAATATDSRGQNCAERVGHVDDSMSNGTTAGVSRESGMQFPG
jgi:hypothetical protein